MTIAERLGLIFDIKTRLRQAIINKGVDVPENTPFADYPDKIANSVIGTSSAKILKDMTSYAIHNNDQTPITGVISLERKILSDNVEVEIE